MRQLWRSTARCFNKSGPSNREGSSGPSDQGPTSRAEVDESGIDYPLTTSKKAIHLDSTLQLYIEADLCLFCEKIVTDTLGNPSSFGPGWQRDVYGEDRQGYFLAEHHTGRRGGLWRSASAGCEFCGHFHKCLQAKSPLSDESLGYRVSIDATGTHRGFVHLYYDIPNKVSPGFMGFEFYLSTGKSGAHPAWTPGYYTASERPLALPWPLLSARQVSCLNSDETYTWAKQCITTCLQHHNACSRDSLGLPKRILDVGDSYPVAQVVLREIGGEAEPYLTLSYSWGSSLPLKTTRANLARHRNCIRVAELPRTLRDAVTITRRLGYRYIWIDALCIVQDDEQDWAEQASEMTNIYRHSVFTIAAPHCSDCDEGILLEHETQGIKIGMFSQPVTPEYKRAVYFNKSQTFNVDDTFLSSRGWVFQERLVSPATLYYTANGLAWECAQPGRTSLALQHPHQPSGGSSGGKSSWKELLREVATRPTAALPSSPLPQTWTSSDATSESSSVLETGRRTLDEIRYIGFQKWQRWVETFTEKNLTNIGDKLPAMAGMAREVAQGCQMTYVAGLWSEFILEGLLWQSGRDPLQRHHGIRPTWSWLSVTGKLQANEFLRYQPKDGLDAIVQKADVLEAQPGSFGRILRAEICIDGLLQAVQLGPPSREKYTEGDIPVIQGMTIPAERCKLDQTPSPEEFPVKCWALRIGRFDFDGTEGIFFLLLQKAPEADAHFERIGVGSAHGQRRSKKDKFVDDDPLDYIFESPEWASVILV